MIGAAAIFSPAACRKSSRTPVLSSSEPGFRERSSNVVSNTLPDLFVHSSFILVPTKAGFFDVMAIRSTLALVQDAQGRNRNLKAGVVLNMIKPRSGITADVAALLESLGTPLLSTRIHDRVSIARSSITSGILRSTDQKAKDEITSFDCPTIVHLADCFEEAV